MPRNPFSEYINDLNMRDLNSSIELQKLLDVRETRDSKDDINAKVFPRYNKQIPAQLSPEELSMKDLLDKIQVQSILQNNISPFVKREIKSDVTEEMIKDFQNESSKPVEINGNVYKFRPPGVDVALEPELPEFIDERSYKRDIDMKAQQQINRRTYIESRLDKLNDSFSDLRSDYDFNLISEAEYNEAYGKLTEAEDALKRSLKTVDFALIDLGKQFDSYDEKRMEHEAKATNIRRDNKKALANYEDELRSRNIGLEATQQPGESDEDYAQRMINTAHTIADPSQIQKQAQSHLFSTMKDRMTPLLQPYKVEAVLKEVIQQGGYESLQVIKDKWVGLKKKLDDTFGNLNRIDNTDSIANFLLGEVKGTAPAPEVLLALPDPPSALPLPPVPHPMTTRSRSAQAVEKLPVTIFSYQELRDILSSAGIDYKKGNDRISQDANYARALKEGLIPDLPDLIPKSEILKMSNYDLAEYLQSKGIKGTKSASPMDTWINKGNSKAGNDALVKMYERYATTAMKGSGIKNKFAIIQGEIEAGNNAPQLIRDARKMLKEMVQQKMVTLYEAQTHLKYLRSLNKI